MSISEPDLAGAPPPADPVEFRNWTPFPAQYFQTLAPDGETFHVVVLRVTYDLTTTPRGERLYFADDQPPLVAADVHYGEPETSSVRYESDFAPFKPHCDILLTDAQAWAPRHAPSRRWAAGFRVGHWQKVLHVTGPRYFVRHWTGWRLTRPEPALSTPLRYEHAYGGTYRYSAPIGKHKTPPATEVDERNPVGCGAASRRWLRTLDADRLPAPRIEPPNQPFRAQADYPVAGFGVVGRAWLPRRELAGTYDQYWQDHHWPAPPPDFDYGYWNAAPLDQQVPWLRGDEIIRLVNLHPSGTLEYRLPGHLFLTLIRVAGYPWLPKALNLDTLLIDPTAQQITAVYRNAVTANLDIRAIEARIDVAKEP